MGVIWFIATFHTTCFGNPIKNASSNRISGFIQGVIKTWLSWPSVKTWPPMTQPIPRHCLTHWVNASHSFVIGSSNKLTATVLWNIRQVSTKGCRIFDCQLTTRLNMPICCFLVWVDRNPSKALGITDAALCGLSSNRYPSQPQQRGSPR